MSDIKTALANCNQLNEIAIKSSKGHFPKLQAAAVAALLFAAEHGQCGPLNDLYDKVETGDATSIRMFIANVKRKHEKTFTDNEGEEKKVFFLSYSRNDGFNLVVQNDMNTKAIKANKKEIIELGDKKLSNNSVYTFGDADRAGAAGRDFNRDEFLKRAILTLARNGDGYTAKKINQIVDNIVSVSKIEETVKNNDVMAKITAKRDELAKLEAQAEKQAKMKTNANGNEKPEGEKAQVAAA